MWHKSFSMLFHARTYLYMVIACWWQVTSVCAMPLQVSKPVCIEVSHHWGMGRLMYFWLTDLYTREERKVKGEYVDDNVVVFHFDLYHPLYEEIIPSGNQRIPFYVEPGDTLIIQVGKNGRVEKYERTNGKPVEMERLLRHDVSNRQFYTAEDFSTDKQECTFTTFVERVSEKMAQALDSVERVAIRHDFSAQERQLARCNVQMQFAIWLFEYVPYKSSELLVQNLDNIRKSISGVNLDEEFANMIKYQHGYNATAKIVSEMDKMIETLIFRLG